eukprot:223974-Amphidinium_carterae.1
MGHPLFLRVSLEPILCVSSHSYDAHAPVLQCAHRLMCTYCSTWHVWRMAGMDGGLVPQESIKD